MEFSEEICPNCYISYLLYSKFQDKYFCPHCNKVCTQKEIDDLLKILEETLNSEEYMEYQEEKRKKYQELWKQERKHECVNLTEANKINNDNISIIYGNYYQNKQSNSWYMKIRVESEWCGCIEEIDMIKYCPFCGEDLNKWLEDKIKAEMDLI